GELQAEPVPAAEHAQARRGLSRAQVKVLVILRDRLAGAGTGRVHDDDQVARALARGPGWLDLDVLGGQLDLHRRRHARAIYRRAEVDARRQEAGRVADVARVTGPGAGEHDAALAARLIGQAQARAPVADHAAIGSGFPDQHEAAVAVGTGAADDEHAAHDALVADVSRLAVHGEWRADAQVVARDAGRAAVDDQPLTAEEAAVCSRLAGHACTVAGLHAADWAVERRQSPADGQRRAIGRRDLVDDQHLIPGALPADQDAARQRALARRRLQRQRAAPASSLGLQLDVGEAVPRASAVAGLRVAGAGPVEVGFQRRRAVQ